VGPSAVLAVLGIVLLGAYLLETVYERTHIPDQLFLIAAGLVLGHAFGWEERAGLGSADRLFTQAAVVIIVFHGATTLEVGKLARGLRAALLLTSITFLSSIALITLVVHFGFSQPWVAAAILGAVLGGTGASVMVPMVRAIKVGEKVSAVLTVEAGLTDVLCIVVTLTLLSFHSIARVRLGATVERALLVLVATVAFGAASAAGWIWVRAHLERHVRKDHLGTIAILFGMVGGADWLGLSGPMAALVFGLVLANVKGLPGLARLAQNRPSALTTEELYFVHELSFMLKTFFFLFVGVLIRLTDWQALLAAAIIILLVQSVRPLVVRLSLPRSTVKRDAATAAALVPKGMVAVVLSRVLIHNAVPGAALLSSIALAAVVLSLLAAAGLVFTLERVDPARLFGRLFDGYADPPALALPDADRATLPECAAPAALP
jgi:NhaP-type Na+/H+ or K+/H+ antiporter